MTRARILDELYGVLRSGHPIRLKFTQQAFQLLPELDAPRILDVGCGEGEPTLALARLSQGQIIGLDTNKPALDRLSTRIKKSGLAERVQVVHGSMLGMSFPDGCFDLIWAEGSIHVLGFERGLRAWRRFIKSGGLLTVHEMTWLRPDPPSEMVDYWSGVYPGLSTAAEYIEQMPGCGYELIGHFLLPEETWWVAYYGPLEARLGALREKYAGDQEVQEILDLAQHELELYKKYGSWYGSGFYVMQKR
jgi:SAM-dependent methyltransferase